MTFADQGQYDPSRESGGMAGELVRLEAQAALSWQAELPILDRLVQVSDPRILEVGCGGGAVTRRLLQRWPAARLTSLEPDAQLLEQARHSVQPDGQEAVHWAWGSIHDNTLPDDAFDLIVVRYVFQHLADPVGATRALLPKLAEGGKLLVIDVDAGMWGAAEPHDPALADLHVVASLDQGARGGDRLIGRKLWRILREAGCEDCVQEAFVYHSGEQGLAMFEPQLNPERWLPAVATGDLAWADYLRLLHTHHRFMADRQAYVMLLGFAAHGGRRKK